ncbi:hypothetical protein H9Q08_05235 [Chryseobacterium sp. PS-8]|uniref:DUF3899 domain-containing protein n=1 Tax=Chryseobacterium indicum TaxID=2766954 RepID=A0ABS9C2D0_9FLAO|nr:hypothetical protein [Chryseobacterium sp. PS-8]MCF2218702.1 hypothetical protein [Chryseobacterium sp. PS-8]
MEKKLKHLEFIHNTINRMSTNSFYIKGWCVTIVAALFALAEKDILTNFIFISYFVLFVFWFLNGFFLQLERKFRSLYDVVRLKSEMDIDFSMDISSFNSDFNSYFSALTSKSLLLFYFPLLVVVLIIIYLLK